MVWPQNHLWADQGECTKWGIESTVGLPIYGTYSTCCASGPAYKNCITYKFDEHQVISCNKDTLNSQEIAKILDKNHAISKASRKQDCLRTCGVCLIMITLSLVFQRKHKHIQDAEEREGETKKEFFEFMDECEFVLQNRTTTGLCWTEAGREPAHEWESYKEDLQLCYNSEREHVVLR
jgi:hypothetical protein